MYQVHLEPCPLPLTSLLSTFSLLIHQFSSPQTTVNRRKIRKRENKFFIKKRCEKLSSKKLPNLSGDSFMCTRPMKEQPFCWIRVAFVNSRATLEKVEAFSHMWPQPLSLIFPFFFQNFVKFHSLFSFVKIRCR